MELCKYLCYLQVKDALITASMDDEYFEATKDTCVFLGGKLTEVRNKQLLCYSASRDLETAVNKDIMTIRWSAFQTFQLNTVSGLRTRTTRTLTWNRCVLSDVRNQLQNSRFIINCLGQVRASTPLREMEPTPLDRHRLTHKLQF